LALKKKDAVVLCKYSSSRSVHLPIRRVAGFFDTDAGKPDVLEIDGCLQWLTATREYRSEKPDFDWGVGKRSTDNDHRIAEVSARARSKWYGVG
jgi:hypothetical protein